MEFATNIPVDGIDDSYTEILYSGMDVWEFCILREVLP